MINCFKMVNVLLEIGTNCNVLSLLQSPPHLLLLSSLVCRPASSSRSPVLHLHVTFSGQVTSSLFLSCYDVIVCLYCDKIVLHILSPLFCNISPFFCVLYHSIFALPQACPHLLVYYPHSLVACWDLFTACVCLPLS